MKKLWIISVSLLIVSCAYFIENKGEKNFVKRNFSSVNTGDYYTDKVQPILNKRCVACHGCWSSPCNLKLESFEGLERGLSKENMYGSRLTKSLIPTRLFIDAQTTSEWHNKFGFKPIVNRDGTEDEKLNKSIMYHILSLRNQESNEKSFSFNPENSRQCQSTISSVKDLISTSSPLRGMPYGTAKLSNMDYQTLINWIKNGSPGPSDKYKEELKIIPSEYQNQINQWETFLNHSHIKNRITARYIYEHLFLAHIYFGNGKDGIFFKLIRSKTQYPEMPINLPTRRPYNRPSEGTFYYRFQKVTESIVHKNHITFALNDQKFDFYKDIFIKQPWLQSDLTYPSWTESTAGNPFLAFRDIPPKSRYRFLLNDSEYFVRTFIRGPVCFGQVATNVIRDHFWIFFMDPDSDPEVNSKNWFKDNGKYLAMPASMGSIKGQGFELRRKIYIGKLKSLYNKNFKNNASSNTAKEVGPKSGNLFKNAFGVNGKDKNIVIPKVLGISDIWDGDGHNPNSTLTIFRHFDSATVSNGLQGGIPKTVGVLNYSILERIYYDLVAGFDVYGEIPHKLATRLYMGKLRAEWEDLFLGFLPDGPRDKLRSNWNLKLGKMAASINPNPTRHLRSEFKDEDFSGKNPISFFANKVVERRLNSKSFRGFSKINHIEHKPADFSGVPYNQDDIDSLFSKITAKMTPYAKHFKEITFVKIETKDGDGYPYTILHNQGRVYVNYLFLEGDKDSESKLNIFNGLIGSYPNQFFVIKMEELPTFISEVELIDSEDDWNQVKNKYLVKTTSNQFWNIYDWFHQKSEKSNFRESGIFDISRYKN